MANVLERANIYFVYRPKVHETFETAELFNDLRMERSAHPLKPLFEGR
jgi:hypothetical protein